ncbi:Uncharacterized protein CLAVI_001033 [Candidatus Clavichlamydia salmonicola]|uniref:2Fe-2S iron-sulfur cluster-binding protein n=1 Tax=Candidatus Clavichlamydia salmonicola TaxID=469812 RepID=UPI0018910D20|nr:2Fe-2S iron-sulfur cluster-binding protein [Candidatus Clavichlamydia salmonicola]MBF5051389.1 Uncharacterized protein [Candidatus Clavichlamydia salmonicola]
MAKLIINNGLESKEVTLEDGAAIDAACEEAGVPFGCSEGLCGICTVRIEEGAENLTPLTPHELDFLGETDEERLACQCGIAGGCTKISF